MIGCGVWTRLHFIAVTTSSIQTPGTVLRATELIHLLAKAESIHTKGSVNSGAEIVLPVPGSDLRQRIMITSFLEFCTVSRSARNPVPFFRPPSKSAPVRRSHPCTEYPAQREASIWSIAKRHRLFFDSGHSRREEKKKKKNEVIGHIRTFSGMSSSRKLAAQQKWPHPAAQG